MDKQRLDTCDPRVQAAIEKILERLDSVNSVKVESAPLYLLASLFDHPQVEDYLSSWMDSDLPEFEDGMHIVGELTYLAELERVSPHGNIDKPTLLQYQNEAAGLQDNQGRFRMHHVDQTPGFFLFISKFKKTSCSLHRTATYINTDEFQEDVNHVELAEAILGLSELDYSEYHELVESLGSQLIEEVFPPDEATPMIDPLSFPLIMRALQRVPSPTQNYRDVFSEWAFDGKTNSGFDVSFADRELDNLSPLTLRYPAQILLGHVAAGKGVKVPKAEIEWQSRLSEQQRRKEEPTFVATKPSTRLEKRETGIRLAIEDIINSAENTLRIATLRMDMLHDDLLERLQEKENLEVRILTSKKSASGPRSKMKTAVMNEMVRRLEGGVKHDPLVHSRLVIGDRNEVVVSSADLTRDQLVDEFNAGVYTQNREYVSDAIEFFDTMWNSAEHRGQRG